MEAENRLMKDFAVLILAAGFSGRMGVPKLSLRFDKNQTFAEKIVHTYQAAGCKKIVLVVNRQGQKFLRHQKLFPSDNNVSVVFNAYPERERFFSLQTGLKSLRNGMPVFIQNIDNPFVRTATLQKLIRAFKPGAFVVPRYNRHGGHPILLSAKIVNDLVAFPDYRQNLRSFLQAYPKIICPVEDENLLANINTPEAYRKYFG